MIDIDLANSLFEYKDGKLFRKVTVAPNALKDSEAGCTESRGYRYVVVNRKRIGTHRIIFLMHHGYVPEEIDHIDNNPSNNRIENLRAADRHTNMYNIQKRSTNKSGVKNVFWRKDKNKWQVEMNVDGKAKYFGLYFDFEVAKFIADIMRHKYHKEFATS